jgi:arsenate reductase (thioredoxin)
MPTLKSDMESRKLAVLFICTRNSARSQMAEGLTRHLRGGEYEASSAGVQPGTVHPLAIKALAEIGIDISGYKSKSVEEFRDTEFDLVVTVCDKAKDTCPFFPGKVVVHRGFEDPAMADDSEENRLARFRAVRDEIKVFVEKDLSTVAVSGAKPAMKF